MHLRQGFACALLAAALAWSSAVRADLAPPPPEDEEDRSPGVIDFLVGEWALDCAAPERVAFDQEAVSIVQVPGQPPVRRPVARSIRHGEFGLVHTPAAEEGQPGWVVIFQVVNDDAIRLIEQVEDGLPVGMVKDELVLRRCR